MVSQNPSDIRHYMALRNTVAARCWNIPASEKYGTPTTFIVEDERGQVTLDNSAEGYHPTTPRELLLLTAFKIWLHKTEQCGL